VPVVFTMLWSPSALVPCGTNTSKRVIPTFWAVAGGRKETAGLRDSDKKVASQ